MWYIQPIIPLPQEPPELQPICLTPKSWSYEDSIDLTCRSGELYDVNGITFCYKFGQLLWTTHLIDRLDAGCITTRCGGKSLPSRLNPNHPCAQLIMRAAVSSEKDKKEMEPLINNCDTNAEVNSELIPRYHGHDGTSALPRSFSDYFIYPKKISAYITYTNNFTDIKETDYIGQEYGEVVPGKDRYDGSLLDTVNVVLMESPTKIAYECMNNRIRLNYCGMYVITRIISSSNDVLLKRGFRVKQPAKFCKHVVKNLDSVILSNATLYSECIKFSGM
jgi:hypothetical protein